MTRTRYTMPARSQGKLYAQRAMAENDEAVEVDARGGSRDVVKALVKATRLNPHMTVCGWPFCLCDLDGVDDMEGGAV